MLNYVMKKKQILIFILSVLILVIFNKVFLTTFTRTNAFFANQALVNSEEISPQRLFDKTWRIISKEYYEPTLNHQNWLRWKYRYQDKIKTDEDARVAIDTMIASLNEPYTRFMPKKDFEDLGRFSYATRNCTIAFCKNMLIGKHKELSEILANPDVKTNIFDSYLKVL